MTAPNSPETGLAMQLTVLTDAIAESLSLANAFATTEDDDQRSRRRTEIAQASKLLKRSQEVATALARLRGTKSNHTITIRRSTGHATTHATQDPNVVVEEVEWDAPAPCTKQELETLEWDEVRRRVSALAAERARRRVAQGLSPYPGDPTRKLGEPPVDD